MSLYDRVVVPTLAESSESSESLDEAMAKVDEAVAKWARRGRSKSASDSTRAQAKWRTGFGQGAGDHRKHFGKKEGGHHSAGAWQGKEAGHADQKARTAAHKAQRGVKTRGA